MKFSESKKWKMKRRKQKRILKHYRYIVGMHIDGGIVQDQARIGNELYLLIAKEDNLHSIYKIVDMYNYVKMSNKKVLALREEFCNPKNWRESTSLRISSFDNELSICKY